MKAPRWLFFASLSYFAQPMAGGELKTKESVIEIRCLVPANKVAQVFQKLRITADPVFRITCFYDTPSLDLFRHQPKVTLRSRYDSLERADTTVRVEGDKTGSPEVKCEFDEPLGKAKVAYCAVIEKQDLAAIQKANDGAGRNTVFSAPQVKTAEKAFGRIDWQKLRSYGPMRAMVWENIAGPGGAQVTLEDLELYEQPGRPARELFEISAKVPSRDEAKTSQWLADLVGASASEGNDAGARTQIILDHFAVSGPAIPVKRPERQLPRGDNTPTPTPTPCLKFGECDLVTCNADGTATYTFAVTNLASFPANTISFGAITPSNITFSPNPHPLSPPLPPNSTTQVTVTIGHVPPNGAHICFVPVLGNETVRCPASPNAGIQKCINVHGCQPPPPACVAGECCSSAPAYTDAAFLPFRTKRLAVATTARTYPAAVGYPSIQSDNVLQIVDLTETTNFVPNVALTAPTVGIYRGPIDSNGQYLWTHDVLGTVFGVKLDRLGNIFVTATSAYNGDHYPALPTPPYNCPSGTIWRIDNQTGKPTVFAQLPNYADPTLASFPGFLPEEIFPALGNISYDCFWDQFFVTNLEDGKICRIKSTTTNHLTGVVKSTFDPFNPDNGAPGFAPLGERLVAVEKHNNRVYYSVWAEDCANPGGAAHPNQIWSVGLDATGEFVPSDNRHELDLPPMDPTAPANQQFSNPVFDIAFSPDGGNMLLAERSMNCDPYTNNTRTPPKAKCGNLTYLAYEAATLSSAHAARVLEYRCTGDSNVRWTLTAPFTYTLSGNIPLPYRFNVGNKTSVPICCTLVPLAAVPANACGGVDYDHFPGPKYTVWVTGDALNAWTGVVPYGLQGFPPTGGGVGNLNWQAQDAISIDLNGIMAFASGKDKTLTGDVQIACPPSGIQ